jgi:hypothetical protein
MGNWPEAVGPAARRVLGGSLVFRNDLFESSWHFPSPVCANTEVIKGLFSKFKSASPDLQEVIRHAVARLNRAKRRIDIADRAIELGIGLEMLLLHGGDEKNEISFRLALYGAVFLGGTGPERKTNFGIIRRAYALRSEVVHAGRIRPKNVVKAPSEIEAGIDLARSIAIKLLEVGSFPIWQDEILFPSAKQTI